MLRVGLTGGIGAGKSAVAAGLVRCGAVLVDADVLARQVVEPGTGGLAAVIEAFGGEIVTADGQLDRAALGRRVFADPDARSRLNGILHPRIAALTLERFAAAPSDAVVVHDVPLLVENDMGARYHLVLVVHAPLQERLRRLVADRGMRPEDASARIAAQADDAARRAAADVWLDNSGSPADLQAAVESLWERRLRPFEENLQARRPAADRPEAAVTVIDPTWSAQAARLAARVGHALGSAGHGGFRVDHVGPTAVPGLVSRDILDLQLVLRDRPVADAVSQVLQEAGFIAVTDHGPALDGRSPGPEAVERLHAAADPCRAVSLSVRSADGQAWRRALMLRDWLRAHPREAHGVGELPGTADGTPESSWGRLPSPVTAAGERAASWAAGTRWTPGDPLAAG